MRKLLGAQLICSQSSSTGALAHVLMFEVDQDLLKICHPLRQMIYTSETAYILITLYIAAVCQRNNVDDTMLMPYPSLPCTKVYKENLFQCQAQQQAEEERQAALKAEEEQRQAALRAEEEQRQATLRAEEEQRQSAFRAEEEAQRAKEAKQRAAEEAAALAAMMLGKPQHSHTVDIAAAIDQKQAASLRSTGPAIGKSAITCTTTSLA